MKNWNKYFGDENETNYFEEIDEQKFADIITRISGTDEDNISNSTINCQSLMLKDGVIKEESDNLIIDDAFVEIMSNRFYSDFLTISIHFEDYTNKNLRLLWLKLQDYQRNQSFGTNNTQIVSFQFVENTEKKEFVSFNVMNPIMISLTRDTPETMAIDYIMGNELYGGNVIQLIVPRQLVTIESLCIEE